MPECFLAHPRLNIGNDQAYVLALVANIQAEPLIIKKGQDLGLGKILDEEVTRAMAEGANNNRNEKRQDCANAESWRSESVELDPSDWRSTFSQYSEILKEVKTKQIHRANK